MTTSVKVHVNGNYRATVVQTVEGETAPRPTVQVGPGEEKVFYALHGKKTTFELTEEYLGERPA